MMATLQAISDALAALGYPIHLLSAEGPSDDVTPPVPYLVLAPATGSGLLPEEMPLCGPNGSLEFDLRVTAVGYPADSPVKVQQRVRDVLAPGLGAAQIAAVGRFITTAYLRTEVASQLDRDVSIAGANRHPSWGVDTYRVSVQTV